MENFLEICKTMVNDCETNGDSLCRLIRYFCDSNVNVTPQIFETVFTNISSKELDQQCIDLLYSIPNEKIVDFLIKNGFDPNKFLTTSNRNRNLCMIKFLLNGKYGIDFNDYFLKKCRNNLGDINIIVLLLEKNIISDENINKGFYEACCAKNHCVVTYIMTKYAKYLSINAKENTFFDDNTDLLFKAMAQKIIGVENINLNGPLLTACKKNNVNFAKILIEKGAVNLNEALLVACKNNCIHCVEVLIEKGATNLNEGLLACGENGFLYCAELLIEHGAINLNDALLQVCENGFSVLADFLIEKGATNFNEALYKACENGQNDCIRMLKNKGATKIYEILKNACVSDQTRIIDTIIISGAIDNLELGILICKYGSHKHIKMFMRHFQIKYDRYDEYDNIFDKKNNMLLLYRNTEFNASYFGVQYDWYEKLFKYVLKYNFHINIFNIYRLSVNNLVNLLIHNNNPISVDAKYFSVRDAVLLIAYNLFCDRTIKILDSVSLETKQSLTKIESVKLHINFHNRSNLFHIIGSDRIKWSY